MSPPGHGGEGHELDAAMRRYAADAVAHAAEVMGRPLDRSVASLQVVDEILARFRDDLPKGLLKWLGAAPSRAEIGAVCEMYGGYVGEIMRTEIGGHWQVPAGGPYAGAPSIAFGDELSSPVLKVHERIMNPDATIPAYFAGIVARWSGACE